MTARFETPLDSWIGRATCDLSLDSAARVRAEIVEHFESERETAIVAGTNAADADRAALAALGDARAANCQYRKVLLTSAEAKMLREGNWEARAVCARPWLKTLMQAIPAAAMLAAVALFFTGAIAVA